MGTLNDGSKKIIYGKTENEDFTPQTSLKI